MARSPDPQLRQWWRQLIDDHESSHLSIAEFCRLNDVSTASFYRWQRKLRQQSASIDHKPPANFVPVQVSEPNNIGHANAFHVRLPGGATVDIPSAHGDLLIDVIARLADNDREAAQ